MDPDFIEVLRLVRNKDLIYGQHGPYEDYLTPYFERYGRDPKGGNTVINQPIDCEAVHAFQCKSCELHALWRFWRGFKFAMTVYGPLNLFMLVFPLQVKTSTRLLRALKSSFRSSCFWVHLLAFIGMVYVWQERDCYRKCFPKFQEQGLTILSVLRRVLLCVDFRHSWRPPKEEKSWHCS